MVKKKDSLALFEVYGKDKNKDASATPGWIGPAAQVGAASPAAADAQAWQGGPTGQGDGATAKAAAGLSASPKPATRWPSGERVVSSHDGRTRISLSAAGWSVLAAVMVILLAATFMAGRLSVTPKAPPAGPNAADINGEKLPFIGGGGGAPAAGALTEGKHYLVIQGLGAVTPENKNRGESLVDYLKKHDVPAVMATLTKSQQYVVLLDIPYDSDQDPDGIKWAQRLEDMARKEKDVPFGYNFKQSKEPWFIPYHKGK